jgi:DNA-binding NtrC family response regulator
MDKSNVRLLVVDHERACSAAVQETLRREGYAVDTANDSRTAIAALRAQTYQVVLIELRPPDMNGLQLLQQVQRAQPDTQCILMMACMPVESAVEAMNSGAYDYLTKPLDVQRLRLLVAKALEFQNVRAENNELRRRLDCLALHDGDSGGCEIHAGMTVADCEKLLIRQTLTHATSNREKAARLLGMSRRALQYKLKSYGLLAPKPNVTFSPATAGHISGAA